MNIKEKIVNFIYFVFFLIAFSPLIYSKASICDDEEFNIRGGKIDLKREVNSEQAEWDEVKKLIQDYQTEEQRNQNQTSKEDRSDRETN